MRNTASRIVYLDRLNCRVVRMCTSAHAHACAVALSEFCVWLGAWPSEIRTALYERSHGSKWVSTHNTTAGTARGAHYFTAFIKGVAAHHQLRGRCCQFTVKGGAFSEHAFFLF